jgi:electron transfer flavoprotein beta subunit
VLDLAALGLDAAAVTPKLTVTAMELPPARPAVRMIDGDPETQAKELIRLLHEEAKVI